MVKSIISIKLSNDAFFNAVPNSNGVNISFSIPLSLDLTKAQREEYRQKGEYTTSLNDLKAKYYTEDAALIERLKAHLKKDTTVCFDGEERVEVYVNKEGVTVRNNVIKVSRFYDVPYLNNGTQPAPQPQTQQTTQPQPQPPAQPTQAPQPQPQAQPENTGYPAGGGSPFPWDN